MNKKSKLKGFLRTPRNEIDKFKDLCDAEYRLFRVYLSVVDWDTRHEDYSLTYANNKQVKEWYLPNWSEQKIGRVKKLLEARGLIEIIRPNKKIEYVYIPNFYRFQKLNKEEEEMASQIEDLEEVIPSTPVEIPKAAPSGLTAISEVLAENYWQSQKEDP